MIIEPNKLSPAPRDEILDALDALDELSIIAAAFKKNRDEGLPVKILRTAFIDAVMNFRDIYQDYIDNLNYSKQQKAMMNDIIIKSLGEKEIT